MIDLFEMIYLGVSFKDSVTCEITSLNGAVIRFVNAKCLNSNTDFITELITEFD